MNAANITIHSSLLKIYLLSTVKLDTPELMITAKILETVTSYARNPILSQIGVKIIPPPSPNMPPKHPLVKATD